MFRKGCSGTRNAERIMPLRSRNIAACEVENRLGSGASPLQVSPHQTAFFIAPQTAQIILTHTTGEEVMRFIGYIVAHSELVNSSKFFASKNV